MEQGHEFKAHQIALKQHLNILDETGGEKTVFAKVGIVSPEVQTVDMSL